MSSQVLIGAFDFGTTGVRAMISTDCGNILGIGTCDTEILILENGRFEQTLVDYKKAMFLAWDQAIANSKVDPKQIRALGFSHQRCTFGLADRLGDPLTNFIVWMDRRGEERLERFCKDISNEDYYNVVGLPIYLISAISKLLWFKRHAKDTLDNAERIWPITNFVLADMGLKDPPIDYATASFYGFMNCRSKTWDKTILNLAGLTSDLFPDLVPSGTVVGRLSSFEYANRMGLKKGISLVIGGGDQQCAALGSGLVKSGQSIINIGTATAIMTGLDVPVFDPNHIIPCVAHVVKDTWEMEGHTQASGLILQNYRDYFGLEEINRAISQNKDVYDLLCEMASKSKPGANNLIFLPMLNGSTIPISQSNASGCILGLTTSHTKADILRSILEGICYENRWAIEAIQKTGARVGNITITGGGGKSDIWCQLHADILHRSVMKVQQSNVALIGASICAGIGIKTFADAYQGVDRYCRTEMEFLPGANDGQYDHYFELFVEIYNTLNSQGIFNKIRHSPC